jgi:glucose dehydrogenase
MHLTTFLNWAGMPCWNPPYGSIVAYDLKTGKTLWSEPFGAVKKWGVSMPDSWGSVTIGPPMITRTGLIFIGASMDSKVRALDLRTGKVLWTAPVAAPGQQKLVDGAVTIKLGQILRRMGHCRRAGLTCVNQTSLRAAAPEPDRPCRRCSSIKNSSGRGSQ